MKLQHPDNTVNKNDSRSYRPIIEAAVSFMVPIV